MRFFDWTLRQRSWTRLNKNYPKLPSDFFIPAAPTVASHAQSNGNLLW